MREPGIAVPSGCTLNNRHGIELQELGAAFATLDIAHNGLLYTVVSVLGGRGSASS
jgi:hypothetical protein